MRGLLVQMDALVDQVAYGLTGEKTKVVEEKSEIQSTME